MIDDVVPFAAPMLAQLNTLAEQRQGEGVRGAPDPWVGVQQVQTAHQAIRLGVRS